MAPTPTPLTSLYGSPVLYSPQVLLVEAPLGFMALRTCTKGFMVTITAYVGFLKHHKTEKKNWKADTDQTPAIILHIMAYVCITTMPAR